MPIPIPEKGQCVNCLTVLTDAETRPVPYCTACREKHPEIFQELTKRVEQWDASSKAVHVPFPKPEDDDNGGDMACCVEGCGIVAFFGVKLAGDPYTEWGACGVHLADCVGGVSGVHSVWQIDTTKAKDKPRCRKPVVVGSGQGGPYPCIRPIGHANDCSNTRKD